MHWSALEVWNKVHGLVLEVYRATANFPIDERYGLTSQLWKKIAKM